MRLDLIITMRDIYINFNMEPITKLRSSNTEVRSLKISLTTRITKTVQ